MTPDYKAGFEAAREAAAHMVALKGKTRASPFLPLSRRIRALQPEAGSTAPAVELNGPKNDFIGPCAHDRDPYDRCEECEMLEPWQAEIVALKAEAARLKASTHRAWTSEQAMSARVADAEAEVERWKEARKLRYDQLITAEARAREAEAERDALRDKLDRVANHCGDHFGERTACGQCFDTVRQHMSNAEARVAALETALRELLWAAQFASIGDNILFREKEAAARAALAEPTEGD
jgi:hypothetical protein